jgi:hypothetical protein
MTLEWMGRTPQQQSGGPHELPRMGGMGGMGGTAACSHLESSGRRSWTGGLVDWWTRVEPLFDAVVILCQCVHVSMCQMSQMCHQFPVEASEKA